MQGIWSVWQGRVVAESGSAPRVRKARDSHSGWEVGEMSGAPVQKVNLVEKFDRIREYWSPKIAAVLNGQYLKLAKFKGEFVWHHHDREDELFLVTKGRLTIQFREGDVTLQEGEFIVVPAGVDHRPVAAEEVQAILLEPISTLNTGNVRDERTIQTLDWI
jgi:mannose-6-phosphate isomerase-like protein (cupin superfamily)